MPTKVANTVRGADGNIKTSTPAEMLGWGPRPGVERSGTPGNQSRIEISPRSGRQPRDVGLSTLSAINDRFQPAIARSAGSPSFCRPTLGLTPQALCRRPLRGLFLIPAGIVLAVNFLAPAVFGQQTSQVEK